MPTLGGRPTPAAWALTVRVHPSDLSLGAATQRGQDGDRGGLRPRRPPPRRSQSEGGRRGRLRAGKIEARMSLPAL